MVYGLAGKFTVLPRAYRPQRGRGHVTPILSCIPSKIQIRQWYVTNYSNSCCLDTILHTEICTVFSLGLNFAAEGTSYMPSSPLGFISPRYYPIFLTFCLPPLNHYIILQSGCEKIASDCSEKQVITTDITKLSYSHEEIVLAVKE